MQETTPEEEAFLKQLRQEHDAAFHQWQQEVRFWQSIAAHMPPDSTAVHEARERAERAQDAYREKRNLLAESMIARSEQTQKGLFPPSAGSSTDRPQAADHNHSEADRRQQIEQLAYQLWESAGRPNHNSGDHWRHAEQLVHNRRG